MADGDLVTLSFQYEYRGVLLGANSTYQMESLDGLIGLPAVRDGNEDRSDTHGQWPGRQLLGPRILQGSVNIINLTSTALENALNSLVTIFQNSQTERGFYFMRPGQAKKVIFCNPRRVEVTSKYETTKGIARGSFELKASDPIIYSAAESTVAIGANTTVGITQSGNYDEGTYPIIRYTAPVTNPVISNALDGGRTIRLNITTGAGQTLDIDTKKQSVRVNGVTQLNAIRSDNQWWALLPGNNAINNATNTACSVIFRNAYVL